MMVDEKGYTMTNEKKSICPHCGKEFTIDPYDANIYRGQHICFDCFDRDFGYCNECGELYLYTDMNDDIICKKCEEKERAKNEI